MSRRVTNVGMGSRLRQFIILVIVILAGMMISNVVSAQNYHRAHKRWNKSKYIGQVRTQKRACVLLFKKSISEPKSKKHLAGRRTRQKPMAEVETGSRSVIAKRD
ncbi:MAG: hypothetical protein AB7K37_14185 [Cyclobacteriaceae bacterium]